MSLPECNVSTGDGGILSSNYCAHVVQVDQTFEVRGVGCVLSGTVVAGRVTLGQQLWLGPDDRGAFKGVTVTCIQREQVRHLHSI